MLGYMDGWFHSCQTCHVSLYKILRPVSWLRFAAVVNETDTQSTPIHMCTVSLILELNVGFTDAITTPPTRVCAWTPQ